MKLLLVLAGTSALIASGAQAANQLINFDDLIAPSSANSAIAVPAAYHGFNWGSFWAVSQASAGWFSGTQTHSGTNFGWESGANPLEITAISGGVFDFISFWGRDGSGVDTIVAHGFLLGSETFTRSFSVNDTYALVTLNFTGIDRLLIDAPLANTGIRNLLVDDITISAVPELPIAALMLLGLTALGGLLRSRR